MYLQKTKSGDYVYVKLIEGYRDGKRVRHRVVKNFGRLDVLEAHDPNAFEKLKAQFAEEQNERRAAAAAARSEAAEATLRRYLDPTKDEERDLALLRYGHYALKPIWEDDLGLKRKFDYEQKNYPRTDFRFNDVISYLVCRKAMEAGSVLSSFQAQDEYLGAPLQGIPFDACYKALDFLKENKDGIFKWVNQQVDRQFGKERATLIFYDVTNAYFETPMTDAEKGLFNQDFFEVLKEAVPQGVAKGEISGDELCDENGVLHPERAPKDFIEKLATEEMPVYQRMRGPSKEHRTDLPLISIALVVDKNGVPMNFDVFSENLSEFKTMSTAIEGLKKKYAFEKAIVVADRGLNSAENLSMLKENQLGFLMAQKVSQFSGKLREQMLDLSAYTSINPDNDEGAKFRTIKDWTRSGANGKKLKCTLVLTWDPKRKARDEALLDVWIDLVRSRCGQKLASRKPAWAAIAATDKEDAGRVITGIDETAVQARRELCGFAAMVYDEAAEETKDGTEVVAGYRSMDGREIAAQYHCLNQIEDCFRIMKSNIGLRPMYVWTSNHIKGHVTLCVLALLMLRLLQIKLRKNQTPMSIHTICRELHGATLLAQESGTDGMTFFRCNYGRRLRKGRERMSEKALSDLVKKEGARHHLKEILEAVDLKLPPLACSLKELATCLRTRFKETADALPMLRRI